MEDRKKDSGWYAIQFFRLEIMNAVMHPNPIHSSVTRKGSDVNLLKFSTVRNAL